MYIHYRHHHLQVTVHVYTESKLKNSLRTEEKTRTGFNLDFFGINLDL